MDADLPYTAAMRVGLGHVEGIHTAAVVRATIARAKRNLGAEHADAGIVLAGIEFEHSAMLSEVLDAFPGIQLVGCTTAGDFSSQLGLSE